jgi:hypothetical protein
MIEDLQNIIKSVKDNLDNLGVNTEIIERSNILIYDKLETIEEISRKRNQTIEPKALNSWEIERNNECYMTLSYVITREIATIDKTIKTIYDKITTIENYIQPKKEIKENE